MDFLRLEIDNPDIRWHETSAPPEKPGEVLLLLNDEKSEDGLWNGKEWKIGDKDAQPLKWRPPIKTRMFVVQ